MMVKKKFFSLPLYNSSTPFLLKGAILFLYVFLLFNYSSFCAQEPENDLTRSTAIITISGGAMIYSIDEQFNNSVIEKKVLINGESASLLGDVHKLAIKSKKDKKNQGPSFSSEVKLALKKRENIKIVALQKLKNKLKDSEILKYTSKSNSHNDTIGRGKVDVSYCITSFDNFRLSGCQFVICLHTTTKALDHLHDQSYKVVDHPFTDLSFLKAFSVRPPPLFYFS